MEMIKNINKKDSGIYFLFSIINNDKYLYYISNPFSSRRVILLTCENDDRFFKTEKIIWLDGNVINNNDINELLNIIDKKISNKYENVKKIYFIDKNIGDEKGYVRYLNNKNCIFLHLPLNNYNNIEIIDIHIKIKTYIEKYIQKTNKNFNNNNLYKLQFYLNIKFIHIFNYFV